MRLGLGPGASIMGAVFGLLVSFLLVWLVAPVMMAETPPDPQSCTMKPVYSSDTVKIVCGDATVFEMALVASGVDTGIMLGRTPGTALLYHDGFDVAAMRWTVAK